MSEHTPGPWVIGIDSDEESTQIINVHGEHVARVEIYPLEANAQLIAAAPDLFAFAKRVYDNMPCRCGTIDEAGTCDCEIAQACDIITKAEGRT